MNDGKEWQLALPEFLLEAEMLLAKSEECLSHLHLIRNDSDAIDCMKTNLMTDGWGLDNMFVRARLPWVEIKVAEGLAINLDGEPLQGDDLHFSALPQALRVHLSEDSPLLTNRQG